MRGQVCGIRVCGRHRRVTLVNIKAALYLAELTNLSHPLPRAAFETHTGGTRFRSLNTILLNPSSSSCPIVTQLHVHSLLLSPHLKSFLNFMSTGPCAAGCLIAWAHFPHLRGQFIAEWPPDSSYNRSRIAKPNGTKLQTASKQSQKGFRLHQRTSGETLTT